MKHLAAWLLLSFAASALAQDAPPVPRMFQGMQGQKGQWQVEFLEATGAGREGKAKPPTMTLCTDNLVGSQAQQERRAARGGSQCKHRLVKDTASEAVVESTCPESTSVLTLTRESANSIVMAIQSSGARGERTAKMRYTHLGACRAGQGAMSFDKDSEQCRKLKERAAKIDPEKQCARTKGDRAECEQRVRDTAAKLSAMCS
jgi:hypothetical protein